MVESDYGSTDLKDLEAIKPNKKEKRPPTSSLMAIDAAAILYILLLWNRLTVPKENNSSESTHVPA